MYLEMGERKIERTFDSRGLISSLNDDDQNLLNSWQMRLIRNIVFIFEAHYVEHFLCLMEIVLHRIEHVYLHSLNTDCLLYRVSVSSMRSCCLKTNDGPLLPK